MISFLWNILVFIAMAEFVTGNFANVFIALVNCSNWVKRKKISSVDWILTALAVSRITLIWTLIVGWFLNVFHPTRSTKLRITIHIFWTVSNHFSIWLATILSIFYVLKITNFSNCIFHCLKRRVNRVSLMILLGSLVFLPFSFMIKSVYEAMEIEEYLGNVTWKTKLKNNIYLSKRTFFTLVNFLPFLTTLICILVLISSLSNHLKRMKLHGQGFQDPSTKVHIKVLQTVISFVLLFALYSLSVIISGLYLQDTDTKSVYLFFLASEVLYPSGHSCVLIWGNKKLKQAFLLILWQAKCWLKELETLIFIDR
ncbi:PREDICTED: taste receptor type 2 member 20-like [Chinchilla lanigera]|uniref:taste receptor type 2 member 20-like n=1 Tax=Chinchilla lanigera TaxID=34839 RepID=UPI00038EAC36|nr:PREDICTED: taste receptor type 2 member 20-like [Chinchilla lanigera]